MGDRVIAVLLGLGLAATPPGACARRADLETWLTRQRESWQARLAQEPGYEPIDVVVCELNARRPYADLQSNRLWAASIASVNEQVSLVHEYLHLVLRHHPHGRDETYVENLARELVHADD